jgi:hypothetical protein
MKHSEYAERMCVCGRKRKDHHHVREANGKLRILPYSVDAVCPGYTDAIELELMSTGGRLGHQEPELAQVPLHVDHPASCSCRPCLYERDLGVACPACHADEGEDCRGDEPGWVHFSRRQRRELAERQPEPLVVPHFNDGTWN